MTIVVKISCLVAATLTVGCAYMPPVRMDATPADYEMFGGEWTGEYASSALGRHGSIEFKLVPGENKAFGDVVMVPQGSGRPYEPSTLQSGQSDDGRGRMDTQVLTISFVRARAGTITGILDRYCDPDRNCNASTVFRGYLERQTIEGTFRTRWDCGAGEATGEWKVTRKPLTQTERR